MKTSAKTLSSTLLTRPVWIALLLLGFAGQLAWAVENQFFNTFVYDNITPDPRPISWMVATTAVVATVTSTLMGTLSDRTRTRWGKRRPFVIGGYLIWGVFTGVFSASATFQSISLGILAAILIDSLMTFFGSTANDAAFNAYVTDITNFENRGRVTAGLEIMKWVAVLIVYGGAGLIIESLGYTVFFWAIGGLVIVAGLVSAPLMKEEADTSKPQGSYWSQIAGLFKPELLRANRDVFLILFSITLFDLAQQVFFPYLIIYLTHYVKLETLQYSILVGVAILVGGILMAYPLGILVDRWGRKPVALLAIICESIGLFLFSISQSYVLLIITGVLWLAPMAAWAISTNTWAKDLYPEDRRGQFSGVMVLFFVAFAMIPGPLIGGWLSSSYGISTIVDGKAGFIPTPLIFQVASVMTLLAFIPLFWVGKKKA